MNAINILEQVGTLFIVTVVYWEVYCITSAVMAGIYAPKNLTLRCFVSVYCWNSLIFRDAWKQFHNVPNLPIIRHSVLLSCGLFLVLGYFEVATPMASFGITSIALLASIAGGHVMLRNTLGYKQASVIQNRLINAK